MSIPSDIDINLVSINIKISIWNKVWLVSSYVPQTVLIIATNLSTCFHYITRRHFLSIFLYFMVICWVSFFMYNNVFSISKLQAITLKKPVIKENLVSKMCLTVIISSSIYRGLGSKIWQIKVFLEILKLIIKNYF